MENTRLNFIDIARAICIILVVIGHYLPDNSPNWYVTMNDVIYSFHMPLFMFVSGYVYWATRKPVKYKDFVWRKFQRLIIPYFFASVIVITIKLLVVSELSVEQPVDLSAFYKMFYIPVAGAFLWFVFALFLMFLIIPFFNTGKHLSILLLLSLVLYFFPATFSKIFCLAQFKINLFYFVLGCALFEWAHVRQILDKIHFLIILCVFAGMYLLIPNIDDILVKEIMRIFIAFVGIVFILNLSKQIEMKTVSVKKILLELSVYSYTIYLFHTTFEGFVKAIILKLPLQIYFDNQLVFICIALIVILAGVIAPTILHRITVRNSRLFSYLIGAKYRIPGIGTKNANT
jgi:fucose 4-O-acetylase-like acetyltransferase